MEPNGLYLKDFIEKRLQECIKKMKASEVTNLHSMLMKEFETPLISMVLNETNWNQSKAADILGLNRNTLRKKIKDLGIVCAKE